MQIVSRFWDKQSHSLTIQYLLSTTNTLNLNKGVQRFAENLVMLLIHVELNSFRQPLCLVLQL